MMMKFKFQNSKISNFKFGIWNLEFWNLEFYFRKNAANIKSLVFTFLYWLLILPKMTKPL